MIAERLAQQGVSVTSRVLIDAGWPHPGQSTADVLPGEMNEQLHAMTTDGWFSPWTSWWPSEQLESLVPDVQLRGALIDDCPPLPITLFTEVHPQPADQDRGQRTYIRLSSGYDTVADDAAKTGWSVRWLDAHHLAVLTDPAEVADLLVTE